jgi:hypothetical protein
MDNREATLHVHADGTTTVDLPEGVPPGDYRVQLQSPASMAEHVVLQAKKLTVGTHISTAWLDELPVHDGPWDDNISLRREDIYGDDGR